MGNGSGILNKQRAQRPHLVQPGGGLSGEVHDLRKDMETELAPMAALTVEEWTNPATADVDAIKTSIASAATQQVYTGAALNGVIGAGVMDPPRNVTVTSSTHADIDAVGVVFEGKDINGDDISDTVTLTDGGGATDVGVKAFSRVTKITVPAQSGAGGSLQFGFGAKIGLGKKLKARAGLSTVLMEIEAGVKVTTGTIVGAATGAPNGTYAPSNAPNGTRDYALYYEYDPTV